MIQPTFNHVLLSRPAVQETYASGLVIPEALRQVPRTAKVLAVGPEVPEMIQEGSLVLLQSNSNPPVEIDGEEYILIPDTQIWAVIKRNKP